MADPTKASVCVAWVHPAEVAYSWFSSMLELQGHFMGNSRRGRFLAMRYGSGGIVDARNKVARKFLDEQDEDWLFWIDTDMGFEADIVDRLLASADPENRPVVGALCFSNYETRPDGRGGYVTFPIPTVYRWAKQPDGHTGFVSWHDYPRDELYECEGTGSAAILIHRSVLEAIREKSGDEWYRQVGNPTGEPFSEDLSFCIRCAEVGASVHVDTSVKTTHLKPVWLSESHYEMQMDFAGAPTRDEVNSPAEPKMNRAQRRAAARA